MARSTSSRRVWGFTEIRSVPARRSTASRSSVMVSGRPASTVNSPQADRSKARRRPDRARSSCSAVRVVGVPPPTYTARTRIPASAARAPDRAVSRDRVSRKGSTSFRQPFTSAEMKEQ